MYNLDAKHWPQSNLLPSPTQYLDARKSSRIFEVFCFIYFLQFYQGDGADLGPGQKEQWLVPTQANICTLGI